MATLYSKVRAVQKTFHEADRHVRDFQSKANVHCLNNCYKCCLNPGIYATVLEFLPLAWYLVSSGKQQEILDKTGDRQKEVCVMFNPLQEKGGCSAYEHRGLICRLFGFTARTTRDNQYQLITCEPIKNNLNAAIPPRGLSRAPQMSAYYMKLYGLDPQLSISYLHINEAIEQAIHIVEFHSKYRKKSA